jgi:hypothetical protein
MALKPLGIIYEITAILYKTDIFHTYFVTLIASLEFVLTGFDICVLVLSAWEPHMPRKKKHPELAYRAHEFIMSEGSDDSLDSTVGFDRARVST